MPADSAAITVGGRHFLCGGRSASNQLQYNTTFELDPTEYIWINSANMKYAKRNHSLASVNNKAFYSICGFNQKLGYLSVCEKYWVEYDTWALCSNTQEKKQDPSVCAFDNRWIYIFGGGVYENGKWRYTGSVEVFDTIKENDWIRVTIAENKGWTARVFTGAIQISREHILVFGGYNEAQTSQCLKFNVVDRTFIEQKDIVLPRPASFISRNSMQYVKNSTLYVIAAGGFDVYICDMRALKWRVSCILVRD